MKRASEILFLKGLIELSLPSFKITYICLSILYWSLFQNGIGVPLFNHDEAMILNGYPAIVSPKTG